MRLLDLVTSAITNSFRSRLRTTLTVLAIFVGGFTLTLTNGLGTGINQYIDDTVASIGATDVLTVTKPEDVDESDGPREYDPETVSVEGEGPPGARETFEALTPEDIDAIGEIEGVRSVEPSLSVSPDYVSYEGGTEYALSIGGFVAGMELPLAAGTQLDSDSEELQLALPLDYVEPLGFDSAEDAVGSVVEIGVTDREGGQATVEATVTAVAEEALATGGGATANDALTAELYDTQTVGASEQERDSYPSAVVRFDPDADEDAVAALKDRLEDGGYAGSTVQDDIGAFRTVIDAIVLVLNAFAVIALLAASFGIVNTLMMSVQERTREIGLMKAMGMGGGRVFGLFTLEAVFIGLLGSALGAGIGMVAGTVISGALSGSVFTDLPGLVLISFDPVSVASIILIVMGIAFVAGTLPAYRAARKNPIDALRYE